MRPVNKLAALGLSSGDRADREEISQPVAFGRPTLHQNQPVTIRRRTKHKYIHAKLSEKQAERLFSRIFSAVVVPDQFGRPRLPQGASTLARKLIIEELEKVVGPHQIASPAKHPPYQAVLDRLLRELTWLQPGDD